MQAVLHNALDPLLERLAQEYVSDADLSDRLQRLYKVMWHLDI